ncbi:Sodium:sulfate symporter transmembrane region family protein [Tritrichomonas foetus]|uniref:Sodium:sulfate symporter transmembrane region family protein n=1 Tax=Tritrichomonas foetus TaxID=1144522 RepID=A0A1J4KUN5_9EUKA|nr:Sodium:sulfate symporter transmembrane region family protein [Tritrichomonas foetus]|eukprot:OHT14983.1 Sodium:sulfate symporter transmembrane region family protein [Tritrichomonas foetus]
MRDSKNILFIPEDPDEASCGRIRRLSTADANEVIKAIKGDIPDKPKRKCISFVPLISIIIFCIIYLCPIFPLYPTAHSCLAILVLGGILWGTETIPSYITAYLIPLLSVWLKIGYDSETGKRMTASLLATDIAAKFMDPIIFVFLGSLTMSTGLTKLQITDRVSSFALSKISKRPRIVLLTIMSLNFATAAFLSNIASTTLLLTFSLPIIRSLDPDEPFIKALLLGLAWSGNAGGMVTTIASVQNILAIKYINESGAASISFIEWMGFAAPTAVVVLMFYYVYTIFRYRTKLVTISVDTKSDTYGEWTWKHTFTCVVTVSTIILWALQETFASFFGHVGITALIPLVALFSTKILTSEDFGHLRWSTLALMGGGIALGEAMKVSGLLVLLSDAITDAVGNIPIWVVTLIFLIVEGVLVSIINHTSAAAILFPVLNTIGINLGSPTIFLTLSALMIGNAQLFHISSFPTALVSGVQRHRVNDHTTLEPEPFLPGPEFFFAGWPIVFGSVFIIASVGYGLVIAMKL